ncbi:unnamed protein product [Prorocentrum cordatum]|uniref:Uncharacterized protein n=1 Tax=Prorocentrum cordatum TaxID=2364126 RepID=A0ABN9RJN8_9DINO|nr:unnamed protein product [Polarella glacialis]
MAPKDGGGPAAKKPRAAQEPPAQQPTDAPPAPLPSPPGPLAVTGLPEMESLKAQTDHLRSWAKGAKDYVDKALLKFLTDRHTQVSFKIPGSVMLIPPLQISAAASGTNLSAFREVMNYDNLQMSFSKTGQYEAAGTVWMLDPFAGDTTDSVSISQLDAAMGMWSEEKLLLSSDHPPSRRYSFDAPLPARVVNTKVAQRMGAGESSVLMATGVPMLAGHALVMAWHGAMAEALSTDNTERAFKLFEAALSVPIRLRLSPDSDACQLAALMFSETMFTASAASGADSFWKLAEKVARLTRCQKAMADNLSLPKLFAALKSYGLAFKGKPLAESHAKCLKNLTPFVGDEACVVAYSLSEAFCPELREPTLLLRLAQLCNGRAASSKADKDATSRESMVFIMDCLRVARLTGDAPRGEGLTLSKVTGQEQKSPAMAHVLFKKQDLMAYILHEAAMIDKAIAVSVSIFRSPLAVLKHFSATGEEDGLAAQFRRDETPTRDSGGGFENTFAVPVANYRDQQGQDGKTQAVIDFARGVWAGHFDAELEELCAQDLQGGAPGFLWHRYLNESTKEMGVKYRALVAACSAGPIPADPAAKSASGVVLGASELEDGDQEELRKTQELLISLRRKTVSFVALPSVGGVSGTAGKKTDVRAFVLAADLFPPNVSKSGVAANLGESVGCDADRFGRVLDFVCQKRSVHDIVIFLDGRSRSCRKLIEEKEDSLAASGAHALTECWCVYVQPTKQEDPRVPGRVTSFACNNKEVAICSIPKRGAMKVVDRAEFNSCGESSSAATTYTGVPMRQYCELPRMTYETKASILGNAAAGAVKGKRAQKDIESKGHPFSHLEVKPLHLWQRLCEHHHITHIVDFSAGSAALAIAAAGAMEYEGVAANEVHREWLDSTMDRCAMYLAGRDKNFAKMLGGDEAFVEKVEKYFAGTMMEARRMLEPVQDAAEGDGGSEDSAED